MSPNQNILERGQWVDRTIDLYVGDLIEYDMKDGGLNILREYKLLPPYMIEKIAAIPKGHERNRFVGNLKHDPQYKEIPRIQNEKFKELRIRFGEQNELANEDIFAVRKDAIFTKRYCYNTKIGDYIEFREKNKYDAMMRLGRLEFYWNRTSPTMDVKGLPDEAVEKHTLYMNRVILKFISYLASFDEEGARKYIVSVIDKYKYGELDPGYYRTYDNKAGYQMIINGEVHVIENIGPSQILATNIGYNFNEILVPMLRMVQ